MVRVRGILLQGDLPVHVLDDSLKVVGELGVGGGRRGGYVWARGRGGRFPAGPVAQLKHGLALPHVGGGALRAGCRAPPAERGRRMLVALTEHL